MKKFYAAVLVSFISVLCFNFGFKTEAQNQQSISENDNLASPHIVISQFQTAGSTANDEFIELHNTSSNSVDLNGYRLVYRSAAGTNDVLFAEWTTNTIVPAGGYYLITNSPSYDGSVPGILHTIRQPAVVRCRELPAVWRSDSARLIRG